MSVRAEVTALHEDQVQEVFRRLGRSLGGAVVCAVCHEQVDCRFGAIRLAGDELTVACGRLECLEGFHG